MRLAQSEMGCKEIILGNLDVIWIFGMKAARENGMANAIAKQAS